MKIETKTKLLIILYIVSTLLIAHFAFAQSFFKGPALIEGLTSTVTAGATTTLTKDSQTNQQFTGTSNQTLVLPNATTLPLYRYFQIENRSTGTITVQTSGGGALTTVLAGTQKQVLVTDIGSAAGTWDVSAINIADVAGVLPIVNGGTALSTTPTNGQLLIGNGTNYSLATITGTTNQVNVTNGSGTITLATPQDIATTSSPTFDSLTLTNPLNLANGGTNKALTASAGSVVYSDADSFELSAVGTSNQVLISNGTAAPSWSSVSTLLDTTYFKQLGNSFGADASLGTDDTFGMIFETNGTRRMYLDDATYSVFLGNNSLTTGSSTYPLWLDNGTGQNAFIKFTSGATTGTSSSDGLDVGYLGASGAYVWNNEASPMDFGTSNTQRMQISSAGLVAIGGSAPTTSAKLDIQGTDGALLLPRLTTTQKNTLTATDGMSVFDTTLDQFSFYNGTWQSPLNNPMTTGGDLIYGGASGTPTRLANGTANQYLASSGGTSAPVWTSFVAPTVQRFTSGSGTYTTPANVKYIIVEMVGGGGGGSGSAVGAGGGGTAAGAGGNTTFGSSLLVANGGGAGLFNALNGAGGTASVSAPAIEIFAIAGGDGGGSSVCTTTNEGASGGNGGSSAFGGAGKGPQSGAGGNGKANSGSGGGGAGIGSSGSLSYSGSGGGSGGYVKAIINSPSATYSYAVGGSGTAGGAGTSGAAGGAGGAGVIVVTEYYQ